MKFFKAITKVNSFYLNGEYLPKGHLLGVARWKDDLYVVALNNKCFSVLTEEEASIRLQTKRIDGKPIPYKGFHITGTEDAFKFKVQAGHTCPDGCCGEDSPHLTETLNSPEEATNRFNTLVKGDYNRPMDFVRAYGPGLSLRNWNRPRD